ncbi:GH14107 [Drosophila grimshawi]|uniref:GH14107 n=2 Tax=Drosophila grimshawi TaxID=7222 RepID=B4JY13_DROGR|nr:GH14107 [Drosophila grimshawi]
MADEIDQQWAEVDQQQHQQQERNDGYKSIFTINGKCILPPLMTPERRVEMQKYRQAAMAIERQPVPHLSMRLPRSLKPFQRAQFVDASTNTEAKTKKYKLQFSETLIYDNRCNAIIKYTKTSLIQAVGWLCPQLQPQYAVTKEALPQFTRRLERSPLKRESKRSEQELLQRASTSPLLQSPKVAHDGQAEEWQHSQLWKRYHSYPLGYKLTTPNRVASTKPNTALICPSSKIHIKQIHSNTEQLSLPKPSGSKSRKSKSQLSYSSAAHAHSHAQAERSSSRMSCTQRRLSYDPRATQRKKKVAAATLSSGVEQKLLFKDMEQEQRPLFQLLVAQQAAEQQRLQAKFQVQQQLLLDQLLDETDAQSESSSNASLPQSRHEEGTDNPDADI